MSAIFTSSDARFLALPLPLRITSPPPQPGDFIASDIRRRWYRGCNDVGVQLFSKRTLPLPLVIMVVDDVDRMQYGDGSVPSSFPAPPAPTTVSADDRVQTSGFGDRSWLWRPEIVNRERGGLVPLRF